MKLGERGKGKKNDKASVLSHTLRRESRGHAKHGEGGKGLRESVQND
jgi:hypothetical protein